MKHHSLRSWLHLPAALLRRYPARVLLVGYLSYVAIGWVLLSLPLAQLAPLRGIDNLFISASAVSTTGLATVDVSKSYSFFGQFVILGLVQLGGLGYMTAGSLLVLGFSGALSPTRQRAGRAAFGLPDGFDMVRFLRHVTLYTFIIEGLGAILLWSYFVKAGVDSALWAAIFHSVSAFCTAGFSTFSDSFIGFSGNRPVLMIISVLSILGAIGFVVMADLTRWMFGDGRPLGLTAGLVLIVTSVLIVGGTLVFLAFDSTIAALPPKDRIVNAFFQAMTASTTVGFNSVNTSAYTPAAIVISYLLMLVGASPSGTGGGLKTTTVGIMVASIPAVMRNRSEVQIGRWLVPAQRVLQALAIGVLWVCVLGVAMIVLTLSEAQRFEVLLFEAISALATVGLSLGATGELTDVGKGVIVLLMVIGRVGVLGFAAAILSQQGPAEKAEDQQDVLL